VGHDRKLLAFGVVLVAALGGFVVLDGIKATLWLAFLIVSYPVLVALISSLLDGTRFSADQILKMYVESLKSLPLIGRLVGRRE
jgi:hypothetical protein